MTDEELDKEIDQTQLRLAQSVNPIETLEWSNHLRELLAMKRGVIREERKASALIVRGLTHNEAKMMSAIMTPGAGIECTPDNIATLVLLLKMYMREVERLS